MRTKFRKFFTNHYDSQRILFFAPIALALALLFLFTQNSQALASAWRSPLAMLSDRSPGNRGAGALYNIKGARMAKRHLPLAAAPRERVLGATRERGSPLAAFLPPDMPLDLFTNNPPITDNLGLPELSVPGSFGSPHFGGIGSPGLISFPNIGSLDTSSPAEEPVTGTPTPLCCGEETTVAAVPEPATWAMMILGFGLVSGAMRKPQHASPRHLSQR